MTLRTDIEAAVTDTFRTDWTVRDGQVVPTDASVKLGNDAVKMDATILYADMADSTKLVDAYLPSFAAKIYKSFLLSSARVLKSEGADITAYDGDRIMAVFIGDLKNTRAVRSGLKINYAAKGIVQPALKAQYPNDTYSLKHVVGIDSSEVFVAKSGVRGANDLVWVGRAANHAAKMAALPHEHSTYISSAVMANMNQKVVRWSNGVDMWEACNWNALDGRVIYRSNYWWKFD